MNNSHTNKPITLNSLDNAKEKLQELNSEEVSLIQGGVRDPIYLPGRPEPDQYETDPGSDLYDLRGYFTL